MTCGHPFQDRASVDDSIMIIGYVEQALEGTVLSFDCPPQYALSGPNATTCMGNGEWEPDPRDAECKGIKLHYTIFLAVLYMLKRSGSLGTNKWVLECIIIIL